MDFTPSSRRYRVNRVIHSRHRKSKKVSQNRGHRGKSMKAGRTERQGDAKPPATSQAKESTDSTAALSFLTLPRLRKPSQEEATHPLKHYGLINQGATCYLNSVLQVLFMTTEMHERLNPKLLFTDQELRSIFEELKKTTSGTENITHSLKIQNVNQQYDAAECLEGILHKISPQASEVFQGHLTYTTKCSRGHIINEETNPFWTLPLSLKDAQDSTYSVETGFQGIFKTKRFTGENMVYCNKCKKMREASSGCKVSKYPQILILLLKRFDIDYSTMSHVKSDCCVEVPRVLKKKKEYKLYGMVNHMGGLSEGHYTATVLSNQDKNWYEFDDVNVKKVEEQPFAKTNFSSSTAYLLMYRRTKGVNLKGNMIRPRKPKWKLGNHEEATKSQKSSAAPSEDVTSEVEEEKKGDDGPEEQKEEEEHEGNDSDVNNDDKETADELSEDESQRPVETSSGEPHPDLQCTEV